MHRKLLHALYLIIVTLMFCGVLTSEVKAEERLYYIHSDHLGSTTVFTDETGTVVSQQSYYPYGETRSSQLPITNYPVTERQYTGQVSDAKQTGLYYYNARYYNPQIALFTQADYAGPSLNNYSYVGGNPLVSIDPSGHQCQGKNCSEVTQPLPEAVADLARLLSEKLGNTQKNWTSRARNALEFSLQIKNNSAVFYQANNLNFTPEEINFMENEYDKLEQEYRRKGESASTGARIIGIGSENQQLDRKIFRQLGEPLNEFYLIEYLAIWGVESRYANQAGEIPSDWHATSIGANSFKGMPINAILDKEYNPHVGIDAFEDFVYNARHFQWVSTVTNSGLEWWERWNFASKIWFEKRRQYWSVFEEFVKLYPEYEFIFENMVKNIDMKHEPI